MARGKPTTREGHQVVEPELVRRHHAAAPEKFVRIALAAELKELNRLAVDVVHDQELLRAVDILDAKALALSLVAMPADEAATAVSELERGLPATAELWVGGPLSDQMELSSRVVHTADLDAVEHRVSLLNLRPPA